MQLYQESNKMIGTKSFLNLKICCDNNKYEES